MQPIGIVGLFALGALLGGVVSLHAGDIALVQPGWAILSGVCLVDCHG